MQTETQTKTWSWKQSPYLMMRLQKAQNAPENVNQDIVTFAGYCGSEEALLRHVSYYEAKAGK